MQNEFLMGFILEWGIWMRRIILTTESGADLPEELAIKHNVQVVPMHVIMDGKDYLDGSLPVTEIYDYYERTKKIPSTTSTNSHEYLEFFTKIKNDIPDCIIVHIGYTSKASSSFQNAIIATEDLNDIYLIDALNVTGGLTAIVMYAVTLLENEPSIDPEHLVEKIKSEVPKSGGRFSNLAYLGGALLKIKPRIELIDGNLTSTKKYRGSMDAVSEKLMRDYLDQYDIDRGQLYLLYSIGLDERIKQRMGEIANDNGFKNVKWIQAGAMISTHAGPGGVGIASLEN
jgi:DegV family protein with EDD domain